MVRSTCGRGVSSLFLLLLPLFAATAARAQDGTQMIADFEGGKAENVSGLSLVVIADEQLGGLSEARLAVSRPGAKATKAGLRISFHMANGFQYPFAGVWALLGEGLPANLTAYRGVRFYARSGGGAFLAGVTQFSSGGQTRYMAPFETKPDWTLVEVPFDRFQRSPPAGPPAAFVPDNVVAIGFSAVGSQRGQFDLEVDQLELYK